jgi:hypothetical protein
VEAGKVVKKHKHAMFKKDDKNCDVDEEVVKEIFGEIVKETHKRRILVRKPSGEIVFELPVTVSVVLLAVVSIFFFPVLIIAAIGGYRAQLQLEIIRDISDEEAQLFDTLEQNDTILGVQYETGDGQATMIG